MGAGQPNWQKLHEMGKLPKGMRGKIAMLDQVDAAEARLEEIKKGACEDCVAKFFPPAADAKWNIEVAPVVFDVKCEHEGCEYVAHGKSQPVAANALRLHMRAHEKKEEDKKE